MTPKLNRLEIARQNESFFRHQRIQFDRSDWIEA